MSNVPDDWNSYWNRCEICGQKWHASEGGCSCTDGLEDCPCGMNEWTADGGPIFCGSCRGEPGEIRDDEEDDR